MRRRTIFVILLLAILPGCLSSCPTAEDEKAKERIFSPEEPPRAMREAHEKIDAGVVATDAKVRHRVLDMPANEMRYRLVSYEADTKTSFKWRHGHDTVALKEKAVLDQASTGDFSIQVDNDHDFGMALRWVGKTAYVRNRHGKFLERRSDRAAYETWREAALAQLPTWLALIRYRLQLGNLGAGTLDGRPVVKYAVALAAKPDPAVAPPPRPKWQRHPVYPKGGPDASLLHRLAVWQHGKPTSATGEIWVDQRTGCVVYFDLQATVSVPPPSGKDGGPATLRFETKRTIDGIGAAHLIDVPEHQPLAKRPKAIIDPMEWWPPYAKQEAAKRAAEEADGGTAGPPTPASGTPPEQPMPAMGGKPAGHRRPGTKGKAKPAIGTKPATTGTR